MKAIQTIAMFFVLSSIFFIQSSFAASCYAKGGNICGATQSCSGTWTSSDDGNGFCCYGSCYNQPTYTPTYTTTYPTYPTYYPTYTSTYYYPTYYPQTCSYRGGSICYGSSYCSGYYVSASDTSNCCIGSCSQNVCNIQLTVQVSPSNVQMGNVVTISGYAYSSNNNYQYNQNVQVSLQVDNSFIGTVYTNSNGYYSFSYSTSGLSTGGHTITARATSSNCNQVVAYTTLTINQNQVCTAGQTQNYVCVNSYTSQYQQCSADGSQWITYTNNCGTNTCSNGYCSSNICSSGQTQNTQCYSSTSYSYQQCQGNYWQTYIISCPSGQYCSSGTCNPNPVYYNYPTYYPTYYPNYNSNYPYYNYNQGYGTLAVNVKDCNNNNFVPATVQMYPGGYSQYSSTGTVMFYGMPAGIYTMSASAPGYNSQSASTTVSYSSQSSSDICLNQYQTATQPAGTHCLKVVSLTSDGDVKSGQTATFKATINNCGTYTESSVKTSLSFAGASASGDTLSLTAGDTKTASISLGVPGDAAGSETATLQVTNPSNALSSDKVFNVLFGQPVLAVQNMYEAKRCEITGFTFDLMNVGRAKETFTVSASGSAKDWIYFSPDTIAVDAGDRVSVNGVAAVPCSAQLGDYSFTINAKDKTTSSQTTTLRVEDGRSLIGMLIFPELSATEIYIIGLLVLILVLFIVIAYILWKRNGKKKWKWFPRENCRAPLKSCRKTKIKLLILLIMV